MTLTQRALERARDAVRRESADPATFLRISVQGGGCSGFQYAMQMDRRKSPLDRVVAEIDDFQVVVDAASWIYLENSQLDYEETLMESGFRFHNPQVKTTCGCGSSFGV